MVGQYVSVAGRVEVRVLWGEVAAGIVIGYLGGFASFAAVVVLDGVGQKTAVAAELVHLIGARLDADVQEQPVLGAEQVASLLLAVVVLERDPVDPRRRALHVEVAVD